MTHPYESEAKNWLRLDEPINSWRRWSSLRHFLRQLNEAFTKCVRGAGLIKRPVLLWGKHGAQAVIFGPRMENNSQPYIPSKASDSWIFISFSIWHGRAEVGGGWGGREVVRGGHWPSTLASHQPLHRLVCWAFLPFDSQSCDHKALVYLGRRGKVAISNLILAKSAGRSNHIQELFMLFIPEESHFYSGWVKGIFHLFIFSTSRQDKQSHSH